MSTLEGKCSAWRNATKCLALMTACGAASGRAELAGPGVSPQWRDDRFQNVQPLWMNNIQAMLSMFSRDANNSPAQPVLVATDTAERLAKAPAGGLRATWFGHSSVFLEIDGRRLLIDPVWSERTSPVSFVGPKRWYPAPISLEALPRPDLVLISHDHYDHLDRGSIERLNALGVDFLVPLGVGARLLSWGVPEARVHQLDWWQAHRLGDLQIHATPARHASGRSLTDRDRSLWCGYVFEGPLHRVYYSGDTGMMRAFSEIGRRFGPFDLTMLEIGEYSQDWPDWHMGPEQAVEAHRLVGGHLMLPVHWGLFSLSTHSWTEPIERVLAAAAAQGVKVATPRPGGSVEPSALPGEAFAAWWPSLPWRRAEIYPIRSTEEGLQPGGGTSVASSAEQRKARERDELLCSLYDLAYDLEQQGDLESARRILLQAEELKASGRKSRASS